MSHYMVNKPQQGLKAEHPARCKTSSFILQPWFLAGPLLLLLPNCTELMWHGVCNGKGRGSRPQGTAALCHCCWTGGSGVQRDTHCWAFCTLTRENTWSASERCRVASPLLFCPGSRSSALSCSSRAGHPEVLSTLCRGSGSRAWRCHAAS